LENWYRFRHCKFFRGLIASRRPEDIVTLIESYHKALKTTEGSYLDIVIRSEGAISYQDIMTMPVDSIKLLIERMNNRVEEIGKARKGSR
jgi:hypothetical protein|tara:strand:- start:520 stop:789 length:270 start_codon:yes stop_codon:yes gene_type:complete